MFKFFEFITEAIGWLLIVLSPFLIGLGIGTVFYFSNPDTTRFVLGSLIAAYGLIFGIVLATGIWKKKGTIHFLSRISATPELDSKELETNNSVNFEKQFLTRTQTKYFIVIAGLLLIAVLTNVLMFPPVDQTKNRRELLNANESIIPKDTLPNKSEAKFIIDLNLSMPGTDSVGGKIDISKNGTQCATIYPEGSEKTYSLDLNSFYLLKFSKAGFTSKVVYFDTQIPDGREKEEFAKFTVDITLKKALRGKLDSTWNVGGVKYDTLIKDFAQVKN